MSQMQMCPAALPLIMMGAFSMFVKKDNAVTAADCWNRNTV